MIGSLEGILEYKENGVLLIHVHGVGYEVLIPKKHENLIPEPGSAIKLFTYLQVTDSAHTLYGFLSMPQKRLFLDLISVSGVGPKTALTILSDVEPNTLVRAIAAGDSALLSSLHGIGKKTAERLVIDLQEKMKVHAAEQLTDASGTPIVPSGLSQSLMQDTTSALTSLGYNAREIKDALRKVTNVPEKTSVEDLIRIVLKYL